MVKVSKEDDPRVYVDYCRWKCEFYNEECSSEIVF